MNRYEQLREVIRERDAYTRLWEARLANKAAAVEDADHGGGIRFGSNGLVSNDFTLSGVRRRFDERESVA
jgi:hypothetical protein